MSVRYVIALLISLLSSSVYADLDAVIQSTQSLRCLFEQTLQDADGNTLETSRGLLELQRPGQFRWEYLAPYQQLIISDGEKIWIYEQDLEQATLKDYDSAVQNTPALLLSGEKPLTESFEIVALPTAGESAQHTYELTPKSEDSQFQRMVLIVENSVLQELQLQDNLGQLTQIVFFQAQRNVELDAKRFEFEPPPGTDIIDGRQ